MYIINTDNGYITKGELHNGLQFGVKEDAKRFEYEWLALHKNELFNDLRKYYCCDEIQIEYMIENN